MTEQTEYTDIVFTRHRGRGITVDTAPPRTRIALPVLADRNSYIHLPTPDTIVIADQVVYQVTGYRDGTLELELVEDWRPAPTVQLPLTDEQAEALKTKWRQEHSDLHAAHKVEELRPLDEEESGP